MNCKHIQANVDIMNVNVCELSTFIGTIHGVRRQLYNQILNQFSHRFNHQRNHPYMFTTIAYVPKTHNYLLVHFQLYFSFIGPIRI